MTTATSLDDFVALHEPALAADPVRHNILLAMMSAAALSDAPAPGTWTLGASGACAMRAPRRPIALGMLDRGQCRALAEEVSGLDISGVNGAGSTAHWFAERAGELGAPFPHAIPQLIHALRAPPRFPGSKGEARLVTADDSGLFASWLIAFHQEAMPQALAPEHANLVRSSGSGRYMWWTVGGEPVSVAGVVRNSHGVASIGGVYTPPGLRGRGYAGSVTAAIAERAFSQGSHVVSLYTERANLASNRCYAKIGFEPHCEAAVYLRGHAGPVTTS